MTGDPRNNPGEMLRRLIQIDNARMTPNSQVSPFSKQERRDYDWASSQFVKDVERLNRGAASDTNEALDYILAAQPKIGSSSQRRLPTSIDMLGLDPRVWDNPEVVAARINNLAKRAGTPNWAYNSGDLMTRRLYDKMFPDPAGMTISQMQSWRPPPAPSRAASPQAYSRWQQRSSDYRGEVSNAANQIQPKKYESEYRWGQRRPTGKPPLVRGKSRWSKKPPAPPKPTQRQSRMAQDSVFGFLRSTPGQMPSNPYGKGTVFGQAGLSYGYMSPAGNGTAPFGGGTTFASFGSGGLAPGFGPTSRNRQFGNRS